MVELFWSLQVYRKKNKPARLDLLTKFLRRRQTVPVCKDLGTGPSRRHIQGSKIANRLPSVKYSLFQYSKIKKFTKKNFRKNYILKKMDRVARLKGDTSEIVNIFVAVEGVLSQNIKQLKGRKFLFSEKISQCRKN